MSGIDRLSGDLANVDRMLDTCFEAFRDQATAFTCTEMETLAEVYRRRGDDDRAEDLLTWHSVGDDGGDMHEPVMEIQSANGQSWESPVGWKYNEEEDA